MESFENKCGACDQHFKLKGDLMRHVKLHAVNDVSMNTRESYFKEISRKYIFTKHLRKCPPEETEVDRRYQCGTCSKSFKHKFTLFGHEQKKHHPTRILTSDICEGQFVTDYELRKHLVHEHGEADVVMNHECGLCEKRLSTTDDVLSM